MSWKYSLLAIWLLGLPLFHSSYAQPTQNGSERPIVTQLRDKAESGEVEARYDLAKLYEQGKHGLEIDLAEAARWYRSAATGGHMLSQRRLGYMSLTGEGLPQSFEQARKWFFHAANSGDVDSQYELGLLFLRGQGVPRSIDTAIDWLSRASESGDDRAQVALATAYIDGQHIEPDYEKALPLLTRSSNAGNVEASFALGYLSETGLGVPVNIDRAFSHYKKAADAGHVPAQLWMGRWFSDGTGADLSKALQYFRLASQAGDAGGDVGIARLHIHQLVPHPNPTLAMKHLRAAVEANNPEAHYLMSLLIGDGAVRGSQEQALRHMTFAAQSGHVEAQFDLGSVYYNGSSSIAVDHTRAAYWWSLAAKAGDHRGQYAYGTLMLNGKGVALNLGVAYALINISAAQGNGDAIALRDQLIATMQPGLLKDAQVLSLDLFDKYVDPRDAGARSLLK